MLSQPHFPLRVAVYIDGFNVFHSLKVFWKKYYRLDFRALALKYLNYGEKIVDIKYFTAYPLKDPEGNKRLKQYLQALDRRGIKIILGKYQEIKKSFSRKHNYIIYTYRNRFTDLVINQFYKPFWKEFRRRFLKNITPKYFKYATQEEKKTDVNIAVWIVEDGYEDLFDKAIIITADSDIAPAIETIKRRFPHKIIEVISPIGNSCHTLEKLCDKRIAMSEQEVANSLLSDTVHWISKPVEWE